MARTDRTGQTQETYHYFLMSGENDHKVLRDVKAKGETERRASALFAGNNKEEYETKVKSILDSFI
jgi:hypothetical protein